MYELLLKGVIRDRGFRVSARDIPRIGETIIFEGRKWKVTDVSHALKPCWPADEDWLSSDSDAIVTAVIAEPSA